MARSEEDRGSDQLCESVTTPRSVDEAASRRCQLVSGDPVDQEPSSAGTVPPGQQGDLIRFAGQSPTASTDWIAALALPFSGGAVTATRSAPARSPMIPSRFAPGGPAPARRCRRRAGSGGNHGSTPSKSAEPTRSRVAPSSMAVSKSFDIPIDKLHERQVRLSPQPVAQLASARTILGRSRRWCPARPSSSSRQSGSLGRRRSTRLRSGSVLASSHACLVRRRY